MYTVLKEIEKGIWSIRWKDMGKQKQIDLRKNQIDVFRNKKYDLSNKNSTDTVTQWLVKQCVRYSWREN